MQSKALRILSFGSLTIVVVMMIIATVVERLQGTDVALSRFYHHPVFFLLWGVAAVTGLCLVLRRGAFRKPFTVGLHVALAVILVGALVTHLTGKSGGIHLRQGEVSSSYELDEGPSETLPFSLRLESFEIERYPGSQAPSDYRSEVTFLPEGRVVTISMNHIAKYGGYRFYQADYDEDGQGSILAVSHDPWGVGITYAGYLLLLVCMIGYFFQKDTPFRAALRRVLSASAAVVALLLVPAQSASAATAEQVYMSIGLPRIPFMLSLTLGIVLFVLSAVWMSRGRKYPRGVLLGGAAVALLIWLYLTLVIGLRWHLSGTGPWVGRYSVMMLMAWFSTLAILLLYRRFPLIEPLGFLLAGFTMLMASRSGADLKMMPLMPVLRTPLLSIHVVSMMMSYTLFGLVAFNGIMGLCVKKEASARLQDLSLVVLVPAVFLLTFGTFLGAVWANISWGSYWAWDPKETWALVTLLVYSFALHGGALPAFRRPRFFHIYSILAFLAVLITYFGVNLILGGMHSYA